MDHNTLSLEWEIPAEPERKPVDEAGLYQRYWEEQDRLRRLERQRNYGGLSVYERARQSGYPDEWKK
jgi:hypothetical protein